MSWRALLGLPMIVLFGCQEPTINLESDQKYTESVSRVRASLETDEERELLAEMLMTIRAARDPAHEELMEVPAQTPKQQEELDELELQHQLRVYESLHGKTLDRIAQVYRDLLIENLRGYIDDQKATMEDVRRLEAVTVEVLKISNLRRVTALVSMRDLSVSVENKSDATFETYVSIECRKEDCEGQGCELLNTTLSLDDGRLESGETRWIDTIHSVRGEDEDALAGVSASELVCVASSGHMRSPEDSALDDARFVMYSPPDRVNGIIDAYEKSIEALSDLNTFKLLFEDWSRSRDASEKKGESS